ncbi:MAG: HD-GYP domain-containing protein [Bacillota bacterium]
MRIVLTKNLMEGMNIGKPVYGENGNLLIQRKTKLTRKYIKRLKDINIPAVYIDDNISRNVYQENIIPDDVKIKTIFEFKKQIDFVTSSSKKLNRKSLLPENNYRSMKMIVENISSFLEESENTLTNITEIMSTNLNLYEHSINVLTLSLLLAENLGFTGDKLIEIGMGALLHDIGKIDIEEALHKNPQSLNQEERKKYRKHPKLGYNMLKDNLEVSPFVKTIILLHHELLDGSGFPKGLNKSELKNHLHVKIITVANMFDNLVNNIIIKDRVPVYKALEILSSKVHSKIDIDVYDALIQNIAPYPPGTGVLLSNGKKGIVIKNNPKEPTRPVVKILQDKYGAFLRKMETVDLLEELTLFIEDTCNLDFRH